MTMNQHWFEIQDLYQRYAEIVDSADWDAWVELFTDDCLYRVQPRENHERGLPLATLSLSSKAMLRDRAYGIRETLFHDPYYQRHVVSAPRIVSSDRKFTKPSNTRAARAPPLAAICVIFLSLPTKPLNTGLLAS